MNSYAAPTMDPPVHGLARRAALVAVVAYLLLHGAPARAAAPAERVDAAASAGMWDLSDLYATPQAWDDAYAHAQAAAEALAAYKGSLGGNATTMLTALDAISAVRRESIRLSVYASLKADEDLRVAVNQERRQQSQSLRTLIAQKTSWFAPEIIALGVDTVQRFLADSPALAQRFDFLLNDTLRAAPHTLGDQAEGVLAGAGTVLQQPATVRSLLAEGEMPLPTVTLSGGIKVRLDPAAYEKYRQSANRADRKLVFEAFWGAWNRYQSTLGALLTARVMGDVFSARARNFASSLEAAQFAEDMPVGVYRTLIDETNAALPSLHRYLHLRQRLLGINGALRYYDNYPPLFALRPAPNFSVADSERITLEALQPLGEDYLELLRRGFAGRWMNVYPHPGKAAGGYMSGGAYDVHPYLLLNHNDDYQSLSTIAHEWGHAVHTLLVHDAQPFEKANYSLFIAESASIGNEMLLIDYMVAHARSKTERLYYLGVALDQIRTTFFRQVQFAEFELRIHEEQEAGHALSGARMSQMYCGLLRKYYGEADGVMKIDPAYCIEWAFIPHFYRNFYVYQYATSIAGAAYMTDAILKEGAPARERFLTMLRAGGSDYPYEIYKRAGIDMATPAPYRALIARMNRIMDQIEALEPHK
ncbi:MAG TPA: M3 family oligoendopeptidase [Steroidobacteraceae bacterium]|jgi:oligoendopeptidase F|nr:M3 family oligoendopeptidase [Steroidobacteraceae bacterium]